MDKEMFYVVDVQREPLVEKKKKYVLKPRDCLLCDMKNIKCYSSHKKSKKHLINEKAEESRKLKIAAAEIQFKCAYSE